MRIFNVKLNTSEHVLNFGQVGVLTVDEELRDLVLRDLSRDNQLLTILVPRRSHVLFPAPKLDSNTGLFNTSKPLLINQLSEASFESEHLLACAAQQKLNGVKDVWFARSIETGNGVELGVETWYHGAVHVSFEPLKDDFLNVHFSRKAIYIWIYNIDFKFIMNREFALAYFSRFYVIDWVFYL